MSNMVRFSQMHAYMFKKIHACANPEFPTKLLPYVEPFSRLLTYRAPDSRFWLRSMPVRTNSAILAVAARLFSTHVKYSSTAPEVGPS